VVNKATRELEDAMRMEYPFLLLCKTVYIVLKTMSMVFH
jgi:hypothetical protein